MIMKKQETDLIFETKTTAEDQEKMRSAGIPEAEIPQIGVRRYRPSRFRIEPRDAKVKISMYLDGDVLEYFRKRAEKPNAAPYQTQINNELRKIMEEESLEGPRGIDDILNNETFLRALKEKLETV